MWIIEHIFVLIIELGKTLILGLMTLLRKPLTIGGT
jgi:hypothetical protein